MPARRTSRGWSGAAGIWASSALLDLLHGPAVAVGVAEEHEPAPRELLDLAGFDAVLDEVGTRRVGVGDDELQALHEPGTVSMIPVPMAIEQADPGGVSCTKRISSLTLWSWSALKPTCSV